MFVASIPCPPHQSERIAYSRITAGQVRAELSRRSAQDRGRSSARLAPIHPIRSDNREHAPMSTDERADVLSEAEALMVQAVERFVLALGVEFAATVVPQFASAQVANAGNRRKVAAARAQEPRR